MNLDINILKRFFEGKYSRKDFLAIKECIENDDTDQEIRELISVHYLEFCQSPAPDFEVEEMLRKLHEKIEEKNDFVDKVREEAVIAKGNDEVQPHPRLQAQLVNQRQPRHTKQAVQFLQSFSGWFRRAAAFLIVPLTLAFLAYVYLTPRQHPEPISLAEIQCPLGVRTRFTLPDGTTGYLNSGSSLTYQVPFNDTRQVSLIGEAYFDVTKQHNTPFIVQTNNLNIKVLGTSFNVIAYLDEPSEEVILQTGKLEVLSKSGNQICQLNPDQKVLLKSENNSTTKSDVIASQYTSWKEGRLIFRNEDMGQVARRLSRWYNAEIIITDSLLLSYTFYATFQDEQLDEVLKMLTITSPISWQEMKRKINSDGSYTKRKIILKLNKEKIKRFK